MEVTKILMLKIFPIIMNRNYFSKLLYSSQILNFRNLKNLLINITVFIRICKLNSYLSNKIFPICTLIGLGCVSN